MQKRDEHLRALEALLFVSPKPLSEKEIAAHLSTHFEDIQVKQLIQTLQNQYIEQKRAFRFSLSAEATSLKPIQRSILTSALSQHRAKAAFQRGH